MHEILIILQPIGHWLLPIEWRNEHKFAFVMQSTLIHLSMTILFTSITLNFCTIYYAVWSLNGTWTLAGRSKRRSDALTIKANGKLMQLASFSLRISIRKNLLPPLDDSCCEWKEFSLLRRFFSSGLFYYSCNIGPARSSTQRLPRKLSN